MQLKGHALLWIGGAVVMHAGRRQGEVHRALSGGRVLARERVEYVAAVVQSQAVHDLVLVVGPRP